jgi:hypothetical protein
MDDRSEIVGKDWKGNGIIVEEEWRIYTYDMDLTCI